MKLFNRYIFFARYLPGLITLLPASLIYFYITKEYAKYKLSDYMLSVPFFCGVSATFIITYFVSMVTREFGSLLEARYFHKRMGFPSTYNLLWSGTKLSRQDKQRYAEKIKREFQLSLFDEHQEASDRDEAIRLLNQASRLLSTKYQQNAQVKEANIAYGFARNVSGGALISLPLSIIGIILGAILPVPALTLWSSFLSALSLIIIMFHKPWIILNAEKYSEKILSVYFNEL